MIDKIMSAARREIDNDSRKQTGDEPVKYTTTVFYAEDGGFDYIVVFYAQEQSMFSLSWFGVVYAHGFTEDSVHLKDIMLCLEGEPYHVFIENDKV